MLGKQLVADFFEQNVLTGIFHLPGVHTLPLFQAMAERKIPSILGRHESHMAFMADGFARSSGKTGVVVVTPGPGLGNVVTGCMEAFNDDIPLLILHVDTGREDIGKGILHELTEPENIFRYFTKKSFAVTRKEDLAAALGESLSLARSPRMGPVMVSVPYRFFEKNITVPLRSAGAGITSSPLPAPDLTGLEESLRGKKRPVLIGGRSLMRANVGDLLHELCTRHSIPFFTTSGGKGTIPEDRPYSFGNVMQKGVAKEIIDAADVVIAIGTRLRDVDAKRRGVKIGELVHIDIDDQWIGRNYPARIGAAGDLKEAIEELPGLLKGKRFHWDLENLKDKQRKEHLALSRKHPGSKIVNLLRDVIPPDTVTVWDLSLPSYWAEYYFPVYEQDSFIMPRGTSPIFYALPASIGAKMGKPAKPCLCIVGDGGILPGTSELATMVKYGVPVVILLYNNSSFGVLDDYMRAGYGDSVGMDLLNPHFIRLADAFGIRGKRTRTLEGLRRIFLRDVTWDAPFLVELDFPIFQAPWRV
jgi:acetolactate synthase-1/2/3 large subunit